ncbi:MAG TPA: methyltransferase [Candidatus Eisenbacteria bacterium]
MSAPTPEALPPSAQLVQMAMGHLISRIVHLAAKLEIADRLADGPKKAEELAGPTGMHAPSLYRFMRTLGNFGILTESADHRFGLTPLGEAMKKGAPGAAHSSILTIASDWWFEGFGAMEHSLKTGGTAFEKTLGMPVFDYLARHPDKASLFSDTMIGFHGAEPPAIAEAYDFAGIETLVDVGGASGHMLATLLSRHAKLKGILFDLPHVVRDAPALLESRGVADRVAIESGSFFEGVPAGADAYLLSHIIHDWNEEQCLTILGHVRKAMRPTSKLLLVEMVLPEGDTPHPGKLLDLIMLVAPGGKERTEKEYAALYQKAGYNLSRVVPTASPVSVVEGVPA